MNGDEPYGATPLDPNERDGLRFGHVTTRGQLDELEQANVESGLIWLRQRRRADVLTESFTRELHRRLFGDVWRWGGTFRLREKSIGVDPRQISTRLRDLLDDADFWADHNTFTPLEAAARLHHRMVQIHPFPNGNGRHARIMADAFLEKRLGRSPIDWAAGQDLQSMNSRRVDYIAALRAADKGDYGPLLAFVGAEQAGAHTALGSRGQGA